MTNQFNQPGAVKPVGSTHKNAVVIVVILGASAFLVGAALASTVHSWIVPVLLVAALVMVVSLPLAFVAVCVLTRSEGEAKLRNLDRHVVRLEDGLVVERNRHGQIIGRIDPTGHYRIVPNTVEVGSGYYQVIQGDQQVEISSRSPQAQYLLCDVLKTKKWPPDHEGALPF